MRTRVNHLEIAVAAMLLAGLGCVAPLSVAGAPCPCASGYCCDTTANKCVAGNAVADGACDGAPVGSPAAPPRQYAALALVAGSLEPPAVANGLAVTACFDETDPSDTSMYLCVADGHRIVRLARQTGAVRVIAGSPENVTAKDGVGADAGFGTIKDITSDHRGTLYVVDGCLVRKVAIATGAVTTLTSYPSASCGPQDAVSGAAPTSGPSHIYSCPIDDMVYVADGSTLRQLAPATGQVTSVDLGTDKFGPAGLGSVTSDSDHLFIADGTSFQSAIIDDQGVHNWVSWSGPTDGPAFTSISAQIDHLYLLQGAMVWGYTYDTNATDPCFPAAKNAQQPSSFSCPTALAAGPARDLYVADPCTHAVRSLDCDAQAATTLVAGPTLDPVNGQGAAARFAWPTGLATDAAGNIFVADINAIRRIAPDGSVSVIATGAVSAPNPNGAWPIAVVSDGAHTLYVADAAGNTVRAVDADTGAVSPLVAPVIDGMTQLPGPTGLAIDRKAGKLYVGDVVDNTIRSVDTATGNVTLVAGQPFTAGSADGDALADSTWIYPSGLAFDGKRLLVADAGAMTIRAVDLATQVVSTITGAPGTPGTARGSGKTARFLEPIAVALDGSGNLFVVDRLAGTVSSVDVASGEVTDVGAIAAAKLGPLPGSLYLPQGIAFGPTNDLLITVPNGVVVAR
jgi:sugar lactone lactonase YvrE